MSVITAVGRDRPDHHRRAAESVLAAAATLPERWDLQWCLHVDGMDASVVTRAPWFASVEDRCTVTSLHERVGVAAARNLALTAADGVIVGMLDDDDRLAPDWPALVTSVAADAGLGWAAGGTSDIDADDTPGLTVALESRRFDPGAAVAEWDPSTPWPWHCCAGVIRTDVVRALGGWAALPWSEDVSLWAAVCATEAGATIAEITYWWRTDHADRLTLSGARDHTVGPSLAAVAARIEALTGTRSGD